MRRIDHLFADSKYMSLIVNASRCFVMLVLALSPCACQWKGSAGQGAGDHEALGVWQIRPVSIRVYPGTRFVREPNGVLLEARIELSDAMGDPIKGVGHFRLELSTFDPTDPRKVTAPLYQWQVPLLTMEENREHYDGVTRTYSFRLELDNPDAAAQRVQLRVTFEPVTGPRLTSTSLVGGGVLHERSKTPTE